MSWRALKTTGTNDIPLGGTRRFGAAPIEDAAPPQLAAPSPHDFSRSRFQDSDPRDRSRSQEDQRSSAPGMYFFLPLRLVNLRCACDSFTNDYTFQLHRNLVNAEVVGVKHPRKLNCLAYLLLSRLQTSLKHSSIIMPFNCGLRRSIASCA